MATQITSKAKEIRGQMIQEMANDGMTAQEITETYGDGDGLFILNFVAQGEADDAEGTTVIEDWFASRR